MSELQYVLGMILAEMTNAIVNKSEKMSFMLRQDRA
jgi:hypothetical protein